MDIGERYAEFRENKNEVTILTKGETHNIKVQHDMP